MHPRARGPEANYAESRCILTLVHFGPVKNSNNAAVRPCKFNYLRLGTANAVRPVAAVNAATNKQAHKPERECPMTQVNQTIEQELAQLRAENARLKANKATTTGIKVSSKGGISVYGLGRFPVTLYASQWTELFNKAPEIQEFMKANSTLLAVKQ